MVIFLANIIREDETDGKCNAYVRDDSRIQHLVGLWRACDYNIKGGVKMWTVFNWLFCTSLASYPVGTGNDLPVGKAAGASG
jgi:hypothetical protein